MTLTSGAIETAYLAACHAELAALKPGNVHRFAPGHDMTVKDFEIAAQASAPFIARSEAKVGERIFDATEASREAVKMNTNLGILLLCAPLARAAERGHGRGAFRKALGGVLSDLDDDDARKTFAAIALASPGGLGEAGEVDVRRAPPIGLIEAMQLAAHRDLVARQYANGYAEIFEIGVPSLASHSFAKGAPGLNEALACFLAFATRFGDSHVARKFGVERADDLRNRMIAFTARLRGIREPATALEFALAFDVELKRDNLNPGTSADLTVASLFARNLAEALEG